MKHNQIVLILLLWSFVSSSQEKFVDSLYGVKNVETLIYKQTESDTLIIDFYQPRTDKDLKKPLIVFMHGGGFSGGSPKNSHEIRFAKEAAERGYAVGLISYRLTRKGKSFGCDFSAEGKIDTFKKAGTDFMDAVLFLKENHEKLEIDPSKIIAGGSSAGAEAILNAVYTPRLTFGNNSPYSEVKFDAVISLAGAMMDARYMTKEQAVPGVFFHGVKDNLVPFGTGVHHLCAEGEPGYIVLDGSQKIVSKLEELGQSFLFYSDADAGHEMAGIPFDDLQEVFNFLKDAGLDGKLIQARIKK